jgi:nicotinamide mononucleotide transporter
VEKLQPIFIAILETEPLEWVAVLCSLLYVLLIAYKKITGWFFALLSSLLYIYLCYSTRLYLEVGLQVFYILMAIFGWVQWKSTNKKRADDSSKQELIQWKLSTHVINLVVSGSLMLAVGYLFANYTNQANPYTDAFTSVFSLAATYMITKKVLENWYYWIVIDAVSIYLFYSRELYITAILMFIYTIMAIFGCIKWTRIYRAQTTSN